MKCKWKYITIYINKARWVGHLREDSSWYILLLRVMGICWQIPAVTSYIQKYKQNSNIILFRPIIVGYLYLMSTWNTRLCITGMTLIREVPRHSFPVTYCTKFVYIRKTRQLCSLDKWSQFTLNKTRNPYRINRLPNLQNFNCNSGRAK